MLPESCKLLLENTYFINVTLIFTFIYVTNRLNISNNVQCPTKCQYFGATHVIYVNNMYILVRIH